MENGERVARWLATSCADVSRYTINYYIHIMYPVPMQPPITIPSRQGRAG